jgi:hypothetical protein
VTKEVSEGVGGESTRDEMTGNKDGSKGEGGRETFLRRRMRQSAIFLTTPSPHSNVPDLRQPLLDTSFSLQQHLERAAHARPASIVEPYSDPQPERTRSSMIMESDKQADDSQEQHPLLFAFTRILAFVAAVVLSYILYRVATGAYAQYSNGSNPFRWKPRPFAGYQRVPRREEVIDFDEDEGYHDAESFEIERSPELLQKPLPERPLPDKPLPPVPGAD